MFLKKMLFLVSLFFIFLILPTSAYAATYCTTDSGNCYVDGADGLDTNDGKTTTTAWKTIQKAADTVGAGDTVNVKGGITYAETVTLANSGTLGGGYITYQAWSGTGIPVVNASGFSYGFSFAKNYIIISGFEIKNSGFFAINFGQVAGNNNVIIRNNIFHDNTAFGSIYNNRTTNTEIYNNVFYNNMIAIQLDGLGGTTYTDIKNNIFSNNTVNLSGGAGRTVDYNVFHNSTAVGSHDITSDPLFVDPTNSDFHISVSSPAKNAGVTLADVTTDILGVSRPQGVGYDIGAYEYYDIPVTLTTTPTSPTNNSTPTIAGTASTIGTGTISSISYSVDSGSWSTTGVTGTDSFSITIPSLSDGTHTVQVKATDSYGNNTDSSLYGSTTFTIDTVVKQTGVNNSCSSTKPEGTPIITSIVNTTPTTVKLTFTDPWTTTVDSYFVEYGTKQGIYPYSTQSVGGKGTTTVTISNLASNTKYYFRIRNGNGCAVGTWSTPRQNTSNLQSVFAVQNENVKNQDLDTTNKTTKEVEVTPQTNTTQTPVLASNPNIFQQIISWIINLFKSIFHM